MNLNYGFDNKNDHFVNLSKIKSVDVSLRVITLIQTRPRVMLFFVYYSLKMLLMPSGVLHLNNKKI